MASVTIYSDFEAQEIMSVTVSIVSPSICHELVLDPWNNPYLVMVHNIMHH